MPFIRVEEIGIAKGGTPIKVQYIGHLVHTSVLHHLLHSNLWLHFFCDTLYGAHFLNAPSLRSLIGSAESDQARFSGCTTGAIGVGS